MSFARLLYFGQAGALCESFADIFAIRVNHFHTNTVVIDDFADWKISEGIYRDDPKRSLRDLSEPEINDANVYDLSGKLSVQFG